jgi:hypothetical protein
MGDEHNDAYHSPIRTRRGLIAVDLGGLLDLVVDLP